MKTNRMRCTHARNQIALLVGRDLEEVAQYEVERHLAECPGCRDYRASFEQTFEVFERMGAVLVESSPSSLWPDVAQRISKTVATRRAARPTNWVPLVAIAAACLLAAVLSSYEPENEYNEGWQPAQMVPTVPVYSQPFPEPRTLQDQDPFLAVEPSEFPLMYENDRSGEPQRKRRQHAPLVPIVPVNQRNNDF